ncbi:hypothetical protein OIU76_022561 [Salix suchowensis]|nr:hypothetical protein OIU76_022561 [Salix suchowensis]
MGKRIAITATKNSTKTYTNFLKTACNSTTYPQLCFKSLSSYTSTIKTSELKLCSTSLTVALKASSNTSKLVKRLAKNRGLSKIEAAIIRDCIEEIGNSIDEIKQSLKILGNLTDPDREYQIDNMKTWAEEVVESIAIRPLFFKEDQIFRSTLFSLPLNSTVKTAAQAASNLLPAADQTPRNLTPNPPAS